MPPKKKGKGKGKKGKGKGKKGKGKKGATDLAVIAEELMNTDQLLELVKNLRDELEREREERNYFQLERDKVNTFWEITKRQLDEKKAETRNKDRELEDAEEKHQNEIRVYKHKVKHLLYEHQSNISDLKAESAVILKMTQDNHVAAELELRKDKRAMRVELKEVDIAHAHVVKNMNKKYDENIAALLIEQKVQLADIDSKYERKLLSLRDELELQHKMEVHEIEERKNMQINNLMKNHEKSFGDMKIYYNDITLNNIALINNLKEQVEELKKKESRMSKDMKELEDANKCLVEPLRRNEQKINNFKIKLSNYAKDKEMLKVTKARLKQMTDDQQTIKWDREVLEQAFQKTQEERDELYVKFIKAVQEVQQKCNLKNILLEKKLTALANILEKKEAQLNEVLSVSNLDPEALSLVTRKLEDVLDSKNSAIKDLQYELARVCKAHDDILHTCQTKLQQFGISADNLDLEPLGNIIRGQTVGHAQSLACLPQTNLFFQS